MSEVLKRADTFLFGNGAETDEDVNALVRDLADEIIKLKQQMTAMAKAYDA